MKKKCLLVVGLLCMFSLYSNESLTPKQETVLISNLNYLQYSISKIKDSDTRTVVDSQYSTIINNLDYSSLNVNKNDTSLEDYYQSFLTECSYLILNDNEKEFLKESNKKQMDAAWKQAFTSMGSVFVPGQDIKQMAVSLVYTTISNIVAIEAHKDELSTQLEKDLFYLNQDNLRYMYDMQTDFFRTCINLLGGKEEKRLIKEDTMATFIKIENLSDPEEIITSLEEPYFKRAIEHFPPYWYVLGNAYQQLGDMQKAFQAYEIFEKLKFNDVIEKDETYVKLLKNKIQLYIEDNPIKNKSSILDCIKLINENTLSSNIGEKKAYLGKIYFLIEEYDKVLDCINYIMNTSSDNSQFLNDAINLKLLVNTIYGNNEDIKNIYEKLITFDMINFGFNPSFADSIYDGVSHAFNIGKKVISFTNPYFFTVAVGIKYGGKLLDKLKIKKEAESEQVNATDEKELPNDLRNSLYFVIPDYITTEYSLSILIDNALYTPALIEDDGSYTLYCLDRKLEDLKENQQIKFILEYKKDSDNKVELTYQLTPIKEKIFNETVTALDRIGTNISTINPQLAYNFGNYLHENNYKYNVKDIEKETEKIRKQVDKSYKSAGLVKTNEEKDNIVRTELSESVLIDTQNLSSIFGKVAAEFYKSNYDLFNSKFAIYDNDSFIIGLKSIYISNFNKKATFNSIGDIIVTEIK